MINFLYNFFLHDFISFRYLNDYSEPKIEKEKMFLRLLRHQKMMPDFLSLGIKIVSLLLFVNVNSICFIFRMEKKAKYLDSRSSSFVLYKKVMRFHDSIFDMANNKDHINPSIIENSNLNFNEIFDFIIIGSGPGGSVAASRLLSENKKVCIIEMGSNEKNNIQPYSYNEMLNKYKSGGLTTTLGNANITYVEAATVGGGSQINSGLYHRLPQKILEKWIQKFKIKDLSYNDLEKNFIKIEEKLNVSKFPENKIPLHSLILKKGADSLNWKVVEVPRWVNYNNSIDGGIKMTMTQTYLKDFVNSGGEIVDETKVIKLEKEKDLWKLEIKKNKKDNQIIARNIILSAGATGTPDILRKSNLSSLAGKNIEMHPTIKILAIFNEEINQGDVGVGVHQVTEFDGKYTFGCSVSTKPYLKLALQRFPDEQKKVDDNWKKMAIYYVSIISDGKGKLQSMPFTKDPIINYNLTKKDLENFEVGINQLCKLLFNANAVKIISGTGNIISAESIKPIVLSMKKLTNYEISSVHLFSSCPIGENRAVCVADSYGKVYNHSGLYLSDCSMLPSSPGVNPQGTVMSLSHRNIEKIISEL